MISPLLCGGAVLRLRPQLTRSRYCTALQYDTVMYYSFYYNFFSGELPLSYGKKSCFTVKGAVTHMMLPHIL